MCRFESAIEVAVKVQTAQTREITRQKFLYNISISQPSYNMKTEADGDP